MALAAVELTDPRYAARFQDSPVKKPYGEVPGMLPAEMRRKPVQISVPTAATGGNMLWPNGAMLVSGRA